MQSQLEIVIVIDINGFDLYVYIPYFIYLILFIIYVLLHSTYTPIHHIPTHSFLPSSLLIPHSHPSSLIPSFLPSFLPR